jgi:hypothetical protein
MHSGLAEQCLPLVVVGVRVERAAIRVGKYPFFVMPDLTSGIPLGFLLCLVGLQ